ncbi:MAG: hypothetical protein LBR95_06870 [Azoarcus sp.]|nr:hypothetical protein [Azoarcus sp.]
MYPDSNLSIGHTDNPFAVNSTHNVDMLQKAIDEFEAIAIKFSVDAIKDANLRATYQANIKRISQEVLSKARVGEITALEGAEYCNNMRNVIMNEIRAVTSPQALAFAERMKSAGVTFEGIIEKKSQSLFKRTYAALTDAEKTKVYYSVIESSGKSNAKVNAKIKSLRITGKVFVLVTATIATYSIYSADNKPKETIRQGAIIGGGLGGGALAGLAVSAVCGPGAPVCAIALVLAGTVAGSMIGEAVVDSFDEELEEFTRWNIR